jgi:DNA-binding LacI/PurR family transcriptional regulator/signal transduction histidine kinase
MQPLPKTDLLNPAGKEDPRINQFPTIGYLVTDTINDYNNAIYAGLSDVARKRGANLIAFLGGQFLNSPYDPFNYQRNAAYDLATDSCVDGLIVNSILGNFVSMEELHGLFAGYGSMPAVCLGQEVPGIAAILVDNEKGMRDAVTHLIEKHDCRNIAFIRGPEGNFEAEVRYRAYAAVLSAHGIPLNPSLVASGNFLHAAGQDAIRLLLDERRVCFEAVVAANDDMALGALEALQARGIHVPEQVAVAGFDDIINAKAITPSLTTVWQPLYGQVKLAAEELFALWAGGHAPERVSLPTELVVRQSCGCMDPVVVEAATDPAGYEDEPKKRQSVISVDSILAGMPESMSASRAEPEHGWGSQFCEAFVAEINNHTPGAFLLTLDAIAREVGDAGGEIWMLQDAISGLRRHALPCLGGVMRQRAEDLWHQARVAIGLAAQQRQAYLSLQTVRQADALQKMEEVLAVTFDMELLMNALAEGLPQLGIPSCYLSLYEDPSPSEQHEPVPEWCRLMLAYNEKGRVPLEIQGRRFRSRDLVPHGLLFQDQPFNYVLQPLYFKQNPQGFVLFEVGPRDGRIYEMLRTQISSALQSAALVRQVESHSRELEDAYKTLQSQQQMLLVVEKMASLGRLTAGIAHEMNTPLAAVRSALNTLDALTREYQSSIEDATVTAENHGEIAQEMLQTISLAVKAAEKAAGFVRGIKSQTRDLSAKEYVHFNAVPVIDEALLLLGHNLREKGCSANFDHSGDNIDLYGSPLRLAQIVTNLVNNAIDASIANKSGLILLRLIEHAQEVVLQVCDQGCGIAEEALSRIFDPMFTTKSFGQSTGLGLTIVHNIMTGEFGGSIEVETQVNQGTTFTLHFPRPPVSR